MEILTHVIILHIQKQRTLMDLELNHAGLLIMDVFKKNEKICARMLKENNLPLEKILENITCFFSALSCTRCSKYTVISPIFLQWKFCGKA